MRYRSCWPPVRSVWLRKRPRSPRATGRVAVATSVPKAGLTNSATAIWEANDQPSRMLFLLESDPTHKPILGPISRYYGRADRHQDVAPAVHELMAKLEKGRPGAA